MNIEHYGDNAIIDAGDIGFTFETVHNPRRLEDYRLKEDSLSWGSDSFHIGGYRVHPYGDDNNLPEELRLAIQKHYMASGQLNRKTEMLWGKGPRLYKENVVDGKVEKEWVHDDEIMNWLYSFDAEQYLLKCCTDFHHIKGTFTKFYRSRGRRIGRQPKIAKLEHINPNYARLASPSNKLLTKPTHIVVTDWAFNHISSVTEFRVYNIFDHKNPFASRNAIYYSNMYSFATDYYTVPDIYGALEWLRRSTAIPVIFKALSNNSLNLKYHVQSPAEFWKNKRDSIQRYCAEKGIEYKEKMLKDFKIEFLRKVTGVLSGIDNTGKFLHTEKVLSVDGVNLLEQGWEIKPIDQNIKDFVSANIQIADKADRVISASFGLHGALGNVSANGKTDSGSEQVYAFKNYLNSGVDIPEMIICKPINYAIAANFPNKKLKLGFYRHSTMAESEVSPKYRIKNNEE